MEAHYFGAHVKWEKKLTAQGAGYWTETAYSYVNACVKIWKEKQKKKNF